jgi:hypothetical protein
VRQTSTYRRALNHYGHESEILVEAHDQNKPFRAGALLSIQRPIPLVGPIVQTAGGIALDNQPDPTVLHDFLVALHDRGKALHACSIRISLLVPEWIGKDKNPIATELISVLQGLHYERKENKGTYYINLAVDSDDALLASFSSHTRRNIRKAFRAGLEVMPSLDAVDFSDFGKAHHSMGHRKGLTPLPSPLIAKVLLPLAQANLGTLFVARLRGMCLNYAFLSTLSQPLYCWGAMRKTSLHDTCPGTGHALHFGAMSHLRALGKCIYDFGGSPGPTPEPTHPNYGVWRFKHEFRGAYVRFLGIWQRTLRPVNTRVIELALRGWHGMSRLRR